MPAARLLNQDEQLAESVLIRTSDGELAGELSYTLRPARVGCALMNPHPFMGGQMNNNIIRALAKRLPECDAVTLRFDYSGVGQSTGKPVNVPAAMLAFWETGSAPQDPALIADSRAATRWLHDAIRKPMVIIGYSFGAFAAMQAIHENVVGLVLIAPTLRQHDYTALSKCTLPKLVIYSDNDFATPRAQSQQWITTLQEAESLCIVGGEHFFKGKENEVADACNGFVRSVTIAEGV